MSIPALNSASNSLTLVIILGVVLCFLVVVIGYRLWMYRKFCELMDSRAPEERLAY